MGRKNRQGSNGDVAEEIIYDDGPGRNIKCYVLHKLNCISFESKKSDLLSHTEFSNLSYFACKLAVSELVYWRDPKKSGVVFGAIFVVLIALTCLSLISVVAYTALAVLSGTFAFRVYKAVLQAVQKTNEGHPFKYVVKNKLMD